MTPTNKLRFVFRTVPLGEECVTHRHILQQWWEQLVVTDDWSETVGEWRDVPLEDEK